MYNFEIFFKNLCKLTVIVLNFVLYNNLEEKG